MPTDILTRIITAAPGIRAELWQAEHADAIEQLATAIAERDIARADREAALDSDSVRGAAHAERVAELCGALTAAEAERDALRAKVAELEARPALTVERLAEAISVVRDITLDGATVTAKEIMAKLGPVTLPAQDRAEDLARLIAESVGSAATSAWLNAKQATSKAEEAGDIVLGSEFAGHVRAALVKVGAPPPAVAPWPVLAGVGNDDIACVADAAHRECRDGSPWMAVARAVVARLGASLVAPVDPDAAAKAMHDRVVAGLDLRTWSEMATDERAHVASAMRATLTAHGIPVTPEAGK